ncbi:MAG: hypothetical protein AAFY07_08685 [Pseudomonadota bacterium]
MAWHSHPNYLALFLVLPLTSCGAAQEVELGDCRFLIPGSYVEAIADNVQSDSADQFDPGYYVTINIPADELSDFLTRKGLDDWATLGGGAKGLSILIGEVSADEQQGDHIELKVGNTGSEADFEWDDVASAYRVYWTERKKSWILTTLKPEPTEDGHAKISRADVIAHCHETPISPAGSFDCLRSFQTDSIVGSYHLAEQNFRNRAELDRLIVDRLRQWELVADGPVSCVKHISS